MDGERLAVAFFEALPVPLREAANREVLRADLSELIERARREAPEVDLDSIRFAGYLAERVTFDRKGQPALQSLHAGALWIAYGCVISDSSAMVAFEAVYGGEISAALARSFDRGLAEDAELRMRERLFLVEGDDVPRLASYSGRGDLRAWLRAAAVRTAIDLMRARRLIAVDPGALGDAGAARDPLLSALKQRYRDEFRVAFEEAAATLTDRERTLLRYRFLDDLSIDEIGTLYRVHRATAARWIAAIREALFEGTRTRLMARLDLTELEIDSVLHLINSQLDVSVGTVVGRARSDTAGSS